MKSLHTFAAMLLTGSFAIAAEPVSVATSEQQTSDAKKAVELVRLLADDSFQVRETAARQLKKLGRQAKPALLEGAKSPDAEVWHRCVVLLPEVMALDLQMRVNAYIADTEGKQKHDLPMLERFQKIAGNDAASRKMFGEMLKANAAFLDECEADPKAATALYHDRLFELYQQVFGMPNGRIRAQISAVDLAALFLVGTGVESANKKFAFNNLNPMVNLLWQPAFQNAARGGEQSLAMRKLFCAWAEKQKDPNSIAQSLSVIQNLGMKEGLDYAVKVMKMKDQAIWTRVQAVTCVGKIGGKEHIPALETLFDDDTELNKMQWQNIQIKTQINDVALAMAIQLSGQKHKDYGYDALSSNPALLWSYNFVGFSTEEKRTAAFAKYKTSKVIEKK